MDEETVQDILLESGESYEADIEDEMDRADEMLNYGIHGEWREWGDTDELDDLDN
jgi:hypothetical protein